MQRPADGAAALAFQGALWTALWVALFYALSFTFPRWSRRMKESTKAHENDKYWCARNVLGILHAILVSVLSIPVLMQMLFAPEWVMFASSEHLATCRVDPRDEELLPWTLAGQAVALAGLAFTTFTIADLIVSPIHKLITRKDWDFVIHHIAFISAGLVIRGHCMLPFNAAVLISMEVSTPFLNYFLLVRHRGETYASRVIVTGSLFFATFLVSRIGLNFYGAVVLWVAQLQDRAMSERVPRWQAWFLMLAITAGAAVQLIWLPGICRSFGSRLARLVCGSDSGREAADGAEEETARGAAPAVIGRAPHPVEEPPAGPAAPPASPGHQLELQSADGQGAAAQQHLRPQPRDESVDRPESQLLPDADAASSGG